jgi:hypothetical protein
MCKTIEFKNYSDFLEWIADSTNQLKENMKVVVENQLYRNPIDVLNAYEEIAV